MIIFTNEHNIYEFWNLNIKSKKLNVGNDLHHSHMTLSHDNV